MILVEDDIGDTMYRYVIDDLWKRLPENVFTDKKNRDDFLKGLKAYKSGRQLEAINVLTPLLTLNMPNKYVKHFLGLAYFDYLNDSARSIALLEEAKVESASPEFKVALERQIELVKAANCINCSIHQAVRKGILWRVNSLLLQGTDPNLKDEDGRTPIHIAAVSKELKVADILLQNGALINIQDSSGNTALHFAAFCEDSNMVRFLLEKGADPRIINDAGITPLHYACKFQGGKEIAELLFNFGADMNTLTKDNETPLDIAIKSGNSDVADFLRGKGAIEAAKDNQSGQRP